MIKLVNVSKYYNSNNVIALGLRKVNLELHRNEFVAIVGESGSGKTTLLNVISGIDSYEDGEMYVNGNETSYFSISDMEDYRKDYVAFVFQSYNLIDSYTVLQNVEAPLILSGYPKDKIRERAMEIIKRVGLEEHISHKATKLSGGQKQRVVIARALAKDCPIIAADEPTGNLDSESAKQVIELLEEISKEKLVIIVTHDFTQVEAVATRKIRVFDGEIVEDLNLKKVDKLELPTINHEDNKIGYLDLARISLRNLFAVPKKTLLMLIVFIFFSFFVGLTYGAAQLINNELNFNTNGVFVNSNPNRIVVRKDNNLDADERIFTDAEIQDLLAYGNEIKAVVKNDYILDHEFYLQQSNDEDLYSRGVFLPLSLVNDSLLKYGRLPEDDDEVVISLKSDNLKYYKDYLDKIFELSNPSKTNYEVVGIVDMSSLPTTTYTGYKCFIFGTDNNLDSLSKEIYLSNYAKVSFTGTVVGDESQELSKSFTGISFVVKDSLSDDEIVTAPSPGLDNVQYAGDLLVEDYYHKVNESVTITFDDSYSDPSIYYISQELYNKIYYDDVYQVSILTNTETGVMRLSNKIGSNNADYHVVYPFDTQPYFNDEANELLLYKILMVGMNVVVLLGATLITYVIFRAIINTKLPDYAIFRTIGANKSVVRRFIYIENLYIVLVTYIVFVGITLAIPYNFAYDTVLQPLKTFSFVNYIIFFGILVLMSLIISGRYCNRIYEKTVQTSLKSDVG